MCACVCLHVRVRLCVLMFLCVCVHVHMRERRRERVCVRARVRARWRWGNHLAPPTHLEELVQDGDKVDLLPDDLPLQLVEGGLRPADRSGGERGKNRGGTR